MSPSPVKKLCSNSELKGHDPKQQSIMTKYDIIIRKNYKGVIFYKLLAGVQRPAQQEYSHKRSMNYLNQQNC